MGWNRTEGHKGEFAWPHMLWPLFQMATIDQERTGDSLISVVSNFLFVDSEMS